LDTKELETLDLIHYSPVDQRVFAYPYYLGAARQNVQDSVAE
jgi:hypothetical protein